MDVIPGRPALASPYRALLTALEKRVALPNIPPAYYHLAAMLLSGLCLYTQAPWQTMALVGVVLVTDWLDGATARRYYEVRRSGYIIDVITDRTSEAFIFAAADGRLLGQVFFLLWLVNSVLTFYSVYSNRHTALPLRFAYLILMAFRVPSSQ